LNIFFAHQYQKGKTMKSKKTKSSKDNLDMNGREFHVGDIIQHDDSGNIGRITKVDRHTLIFRPFKGQEDDNNGLPSPTQGESITVLDDIDYDELNDKPSSPAAKLADVINPRIQMAFEAKVHLYAAWDMATDLTDPALQDDKEKAQAERIKGIFQDAACVVDDILDNAIGDAAQKVADEMRSIKRAAKSTA
jgi:hypothetical protein